MKHRKVLLVTYHFPPSAAVGGFRLLGFARHLPACGWETVVVAPPHGPHDPVDERLVRMVPVNTRVYSVAFPRCSKIVRRLAGNGVWLPAAYQACARAVREQRPDAVLTSGPPHVVHLLGRLLKGRYGLPWVVDCRDPWIKGTGEDAPRSLSGHVESLQEDLVFQAADAIVANTPRACAALQRDYPRLAHKIEAITNGYDPESFPAPPIRPARSPDIHMLHTGELYLGRDPRPLFDAMKALDCRIGTQSLKVSFLGSATDPRFNWVREAQLRGLERHVSFPGQVSYQEALGAMVGADILVLLQSSQQKVAIPAKLFEYLGAHRPILALVDADSDTAWVLRKSGVLYRLANPLDPLAIRQALVDLIAAARGASCQLADVPQASPANNAFQPLAEEFTRAHTARMLARLLDRCVAGSRRRRCQRRQPGSNHDAASVVYNGCQNHQP